MKTCSIYVFNIHINTSNITRVSQDIPKLKMRLTYFQTHKDNFKKCFEISLVEIIHVNTLHFNFRQ